MFKKLKTEYVKWRHERYIFLKMELLDMKTAISKIYALRN